MRASPRRSKVSRSRVAELLSALAKVLSERSDGWYVFGAQAVNVWAMPRTTGDVDVTASLPGTDHSGFVSAMRRAGFDLRVRDIDGFVRRTRVFPFVHRKSRIPLDIVLAGPGLEEEFLQRARKLNLGGVVVPVISPEDLIVTKILAGRPKDIEDVRAILRARLKKLDLRRIRGFLRLLEDAIGRTDLKQSFEKELAAERKKANR